MTAIIAAELKKQFIDSNGDPLNGGKLHIYLAGTTTNTTSYTSEAATTPNANPVVLNTRGEPDSGGVFLNPNSYKFVLKDSSDVTIWTQDNITVRDFGAEIDDLSVSVTDVNTAISTSSAPNRIVSGTKSANSSKSEFITPIGSSNQVTILGTTTNLVYIVEDTQYTIATDFVASGLSSPASSNNTALVNDASLAGAAITKTLGEFGSVIPYDAAGSEITSRDGELQAFKQNSGYFIGRIDNTNSCIKECKRGFFYNSSAAPIERVTVSDNATITLMKLTHLYLVTDGSLLVSYTEPVYAATQPASPADGDMWYDTTSTEKKWKRFNSTVYIDAACVFVGWAITDESGNTVGARSAEFHGSFNSENTFNFKHVDSTSVRSSERDNSISVFGTNLKFTNSAKTFDIVANIESGETEAASTDYWPYIKENGDSILSPHAPHDERGTLKGFYHPYESWRYPGGKVFNNSSSNFLSSSVVDTPEVKTDKLAFKSVAAAFLTGAHIECLFVDASSADTIVTLHSAATCLGQKIKIKKTDTGAYGVLITPMNSETLDGESVYYLFGEGTIIEMVSDGSNWQVLTYPREQTCYIKDVKATNSSGGTSTTSLTKRTLNTLSGDSVACGVSVTSDRPKLRPGEYKFKAWVPQYSGALQGKAILYNYTQSADVLIGSSVRCEAGETVLIMIMGNLSVSADREYEVRHISGVAAANGLGYQANLGSKSEVYTQVEITRLK